jgi:hypothetical protein
MEIMEGSGQAVVVKGVATVAAVSLTIAGLGIALSGLLKPLRRFEQKTDKKA